MRRGIATIADLRARSIIDPVTRCWHWQGAKGPDGTPRIHTFDHDRCEKHTLPGASAVWNIGMQRGLNGMIAYRGCFCTDCVNPVHIRRAKDRAEIGRAMAASGKLRGNSVETRRANMALAHAAQGIVYTPPEVVLRVRSMAGTGRAIARATGLSETTVSRIRRNESHRHLLPADQPMREAA